MRRLLTVLIFSVPVLLIVLAIYIVGFTPDVVTQTVVYEHSHMIGVLFGMLGIGALMVAAMVADTLDFR